MPEIIKDCEQGTTLWHSMRLGSVGGTGINKILGGGKGRQGLLYQLAAEIITGQPTESPNVKWFERGHEFEPIARSHYEFIKDVEVEEVALIKSDIPQIHVSPDGLVGDDGGIEIKTHIAPVFIETVVKDDVNKIAIAYRRQMQHFLWVSGRSYCDFVAYCPEMPNPAWIRRVERDTDMIAEIKIKSVKFLAELDELVKRLS